MAMPMLLARLQGVFSRVILLLGLHPCIVPAADLERAEINHAFVASLAQDLADKPYQLKGTDIPTALRNLDYDQYHRVRFLDEHSLWKTENLAFQVQFYPPGYLFHRSVTLHEFTPSHVQSLPFVRTYFDFDGLDIGGSLPGSIGYAGFKLLAHLNDPARWDECVSFLGSNYYRALAPGQRYGLSARAVVVNTATGQTEEFPDFVEFWLGKPAPGRNEVTVHGLLDGPSLSGAYSFRIQPGQNTVIDVAASLFFRTAVSTLGLAPLTSMFWFGENTARSFADFRPEVHDSDGLLVATAENDRLWRPLQNPPSPSTTDLAGTGAFGLLQRDRSFSSYEDLEARLDLRPSVWIEPLENWPPGTVRLIELPTTNAHLDNIVAFWALKPSPTRGQRMDFSYRQHWTSAPRFAGPDGWVKSTRQSAHVEGHPNQTLFVVDFVSPQFAQLPADATVTVKCTTPPETRIVDQQAIRNDVDGTWRMILRLQAATSAAHPLDLQAQLELDGRPITEAWHARWNP